MAGQDEERVVDADTEGEHQPYDGGDLGHRGEAGKDAEGAGADQDRDERHADRETHGHHGAEGHRQDDGCDQDGDHLATAASRGTRVAQASVVLDLESGVSGNLGRLLRFVVHGGRDLLDVEADRGHAGGVILADRGTAGVVGIRDRDDVRALSELIHSRLDRARSPRDW